MTWWLQFNSFLSYHIKIRGNRRTQIWESLTSAIKLRINGTEVKANQINKKIDIGPFIKSGINTIEVEVATTLNNRLKKLYNVERRKDDHYGLPGSMVQYYQRQGVVKRLLNFVMTVE